VLSTSPIITARTHCEATSSGSLAVARIHAHAGERPHDVAARAGNHAQLARRAVRRHQLVVARAAVDGAVARDAQDVRPGVAGELERRHPRLGVLEAAHDVGLADDPVGPGAVGQVHDDARRAPLPRRDVAPRAAVGGVRRAVADRVEHEAVVPGVAGEAVGAEAAVEPVVAVGADQLVVALVAEQPVDARAADQPVVARPAAHVAVRALRPEDPDVAAHVVLCRPDDLEHVVAEAAAEHHGLLAAAQAVGAGAAGDPSRLAADVVALARLAVVGDAVERRAHRLRAVPVVDGPAAPADQAVRARAARPRRGAPAARRLQGVGAVAAPHPDRQRRLRDHEAVVAVAEVELRAGERAAGVGTGGGLAEDGVRRLLTAAVAGAQRRRAAYPRALEAQVVGLAGVRGHPQLQVVERRDGREALDPRIARVAAHDGQLDGGRLRGRGEEQGGEEGGGGEPHRPTLVSGGGRR
jgi:hypothetical protein